MEHGDQFPYRDIIATIVNDKQLNKKKRKPYGLNRSVQIIEFTIEMQLHIL